MGERKAFQSEAPKRLNPVWVCPSCGKTAHISRRYCDCHAELRGAKVAESADPPDCGRCNFETQGLGCADCPEGCAYCASFGLFTTNGQGFGGQGCRHRSTGTARCYCCQAQVKLAEKLAGVDLSRIIGEARKRADGEKNLFLKAADIIREDISQPILPRIKRAEEALIGVPRS